MYLSFKNFLFNIIPGSGDANYIYLGVIILLFASLFTNKKYLPLMITCFVAMSIKMMDSIFLAQPAGIVLLQLIHMILIPFAITFLVKKP